MNQAAEANIAIDPRFSIGKLDIIYAATHIILPGERPILSLLGGELRIEFSYRETEQDCDKALTGFKIENNRLQVEFINHKSPLGHSSLQDAEIGSIAEKKIIARFANYSIVATKILIIQIGLTSG